MTEDTFGIGVVGAGFIVSEAHVPSVGYIPGATVAGIQNRTRETAREVAEHCRESGVGDPSVYGDGEIDGLVADPAVDGIWVTTPNHTRIDTLEQVLAGVEAGGQIDGVAIEKPVGRTLAEADRVIDLVEEAGIPHAYLENWIHEPAIEKMRRLLWERGREAGRPYIARAQAEHGGPHAGWFWDARKQGGGALTDMLCHSLAGNEFLLSDPAGDRPTPIAVTADTDTLKWSRPAYAAELEDDYGIDYRANPAEDYARATVTYESADGEPIRSEASGSWCYVGAGVRRTIELLGPEYSGRVENDESNQSVFFSDALASDAGWAEKQNATSGRMPIDAAEVVTGGYVAENADAVAAFDAGENGALDLHDGRDVLELCMAAYRSAETGEEVVLADADLGEYTPPPARE
jgi:predicted dehydrogenase